MDALRNLETVAILLGGLPCWRYADGTVLPMIAGGADGEGAGGDGGSGGSGSGSGSGGSGGGAGAGGTGGSGSGGGSGSEGAGSGAGGEGEGGGDGADDAQLLARLKEAGLKADDIRALSDLRHENAKHRVEANKYKARAALADDLEAKQKALAKAFGLEGQDPDPEKLQQQLSETNTRYRRERLRNVVTGAAAKAKADPELTWALLHSSGDLDDIDVEADDLEKQIASRVKSAVDGNPRLKAEDAPARGGADRSNGADGGKPTDMNDRIRRAAGRT